MSAFIDFSTGAGLASSTGVRPYLPPLLAGGLARGDIAIDFDGTDFSFLESPAFLGGVVAVGVVAFLIERSRAPDAGRGAAEFLSGIVGLLLGALLFAGALADGGHDTWVGLVLGPLCAVLGWLAIGGLVEGARVRLEQEQAALLTAYADGAALVLAAIAIFVPPLALLAIPGFILLLLGGRRRQGEKYAGLRILR
ncbi:MAG TPA: DUF4126 family protein [Thermoleophilaceae bacterium]|nr:DUF4126 family protein [Thermoleophilaceae bacterium]